MAGQPEHLPGVSIHDEVLPACEFTTLHLRRGQVLRIIDLEGQQVLDFAAYHPANHEEKLSCIYSNTLNGAWRLKQGHVIYTNRCNEMLTITDDQLGIHHSGGGCCNNELYVSRFGKPHRNCFDNLMAALEPHGVQRTELEADCIFNFFMNLEYNPDGSFKFASPPTTAGDYVDVRAEMDILAGLSNCPQDLTATNGFNPTPLRLIIYEPSGA
jgi:hypothetical protein